LSRKKTEMVRGGAVIEDSGEATCAKRERGRKKKKKRGRGNAFIWCRKSNMEGWPDLGKNQGKRVKIAFAEK